jgi:four helix bundle protein
MPRNDGYAIDERAFKFCCDVVAFASTIPAGPKANQLIDRLVSAAGSIGGSPDEAPAGPTDSAPARDVDIVLRAANESERWLRACAVRNLGARAECMRLVSEARALRALTTAKSRNSP